MGCKHSKAAIESAEGPDHERRPETSAAAAAVEVKPNASSTPIPTTPIEDAPANQTEEILAKGFNGEKSRLERRSDPREQILVYYNTVGVTEERKEEISQEMAVPVHKSAEICPTSPTSPSVFTVWRPCSNDAIRKMVEGQGVGKGLDIKGKSAKAGCLSGFVPYLQIHEEADKSKVKTLERGGRTRIFFASREARDHVLEELGPLQNHILNAVQDAKRTVKRNVVSVISAGRSTTKAAKTSITTSIQSVSSTGSSVLGTVGDSLSFMMTGKEALPTSDTAADNVSGLLVPANRVENFSSVSKTVITNRITKTTTAISTNAAKIAIPVNEGLSLAGAKVVSIGQLATDTVHDLSHHAAKIASPVSDNIRKGASIATNTASMLHQRSSEAVTQVSVHAIHSAKTTANAATSFIAKPVHRTIKDISIKGLGLGGGKDGDEVDWALKRLLWDMDDPSIRPIDDYDDDCFGIEMPDRLLWQAFVVDSDISRSQDSRWYNARPSQPAFQDMNFIAISKSRKHRKQHPDSSDPLVVLWQTCTGEGEDNDLMDPRGLVMAYEECGRVLPVVSDFDCFTMGSKNVRYERLPDEQLDLLDWCISSIEEVLESQGDFRKNASWTDRWFEVLKANATKGFHPDIPKYGFGDAKSYGIVEEAVSFLQDSGAVRHGAECFNFYFPQELDQQFLIVSDGFPEKWRYVNVKELQDFLLERIQEGFTFPLNPKWVLTDDERWKGLYDRLLGSTDTCVQESVEAWYPPEIRARIEAIRELHPHGFMGGPSEEDPEEAADLALLALERQMIFRRARAKLCSAFFMLRLFQIVRERRALLECEEEAEDESPEEIGCELVDGQGSMSQNVGRKPSE
jgi:hypothetical protein